MITRTFKLTIATETKEEMQRESEHLAMVYGAEEVEPEGCHGCKHRQLTPDYTGFLCDVCKRYWDDKYEKGDQ